MQFVNQLPLTYPKQGLVERKDLCCVVLRAVGRAPLRVLCLQTLHKQIRTMTLLQHRATEARPSSSGVRARARGIIEQAGNWPCKLSSLSACGVQPCKKDAGLEGLEMLQRRKNEFLCVAEGGPSPTSVTDAAAWEVMPRSAMSLDSVAAALQGSSTSHYLSQGDGIETAGMCHQTNTRYGGGMFASLKGAHNTWQGHTECDASNTRQRHALAMALARGAHDAEAVDSREQIELKGKKEEEGTGKESLMGLLMKGLGDEKSSPAQTFAQMTRTPPSGYTGVRASAFAFVTSNVAAASGRSAPERSDASPRVPIKNNNTPINRETYKTARPRADVDAKPSTLSARRPEAVCSVCRRPEAVSSREGISKRNAEW